MTRLPHESSINTSSSTHFVYRWWFIAIVFACFILPPYSIQSVPSSEIPNLIGHVLANPVAYASDLMVILAKICLGFVVLISLARSSIAPKLLLGYYGLILLIVGITQNISFASPYPPTWIIGNTILQYFLALMCFVALKSPGVTVSVPVITKIALGFLATVAYLMPYRVINDVVIADFGLSLLTSPSGLTYCMITPVIISALLITNRRLYAPTFYAICAVGLLFGLVNVVMWFGLHPESWWMGVLHLPLLITSLYGLKVIRSSLHQK